MTTDSKKSNIIPFVIIGVMFGIFGFVTWINSVLIPFMKSVCELTQSQAYLVATASYISFVVMAIPASMILKKVGYKNGMSLGLIIMAIGALVFIPAAGSRTYYMFLGGIFLQGVGMTILQTACNPYITILGPIESAAKRISIMGICNKAAGGFGSILFGGILLSGIITAQEKLNNEGISLAEKSLILDEAASSVVAPYIVMACILGLFGVLIRFAPLPDLAEGGDDEEGTSTDDGTKKTSIFQFPHLILGVIALFFYVGVEVAAGDTIVSYALAMGLDGAEKYTSFTLGAMIVMYILGALLIPKVISQTNALRLSGLLGAIFTLCILFTSGSTSVLFVAALGIANALVWPAIWPLALNGLGSFTKTGSALLIMAISGGAVIPPLFGLIVDGRKSGLIDSGLTATEAVASASTSGYWLLLPLYAFILYYAISGHKLGLKK
jgi:glucose/galactose transporter